MAVDWDEHWDGMFEKLCSWAEEHGTPWVPRKLQLGRWACTQAVYYRRGELLPERVRRLESVPGWSWERRRRQPDVELWWRRFEEVETFVATANAWPSGVPLPVQSWVRHQWRATDADRLSEEQSAALKGLPSWTHSLPRRVTWDESLARLRQIKLSERLPPPDLLVWVNVQRRRHREGRLEPAQIAELESLKGWSWQKVRRPRRARWAAFIAELRAVAEEGGVEAMLRDRPSGSPAGRAMYWRSQYRAGRLGQAQIAELEALPGWSWNVRPKPEPARLRRWHAFVAELTEYVAEHGTLEELPANGPAGSLARQAYNWRLKRNKGRLSSGQIEELRALPGWQWSRRRKPTVDMVAWEVKLDRLKMTVADCGSCRAVPMDGVEGQVGRWAKTQRHRGRKGLLNAEQIRALEEIDGWDWGRPPRS